MAETTVDKIGAAHETSDLHPHEALRTYYVIFAWLMGLLILTVIASLIPFDKFAPGLNVIIALAIATPLGAWFVYRAALKGNLVRPWWVRRRLAREALAAV